MEASSAQGGWKVQKMKSTEVGRVEGFNPYPLIQQVLSTGRGMDQLERLLAIYEKFQADQRQILFTEALASFQADVPPIQKNKLVDQGVNDKGNQRPKYKFAELGTVERAIKPFMKMHGLTKQWAYGFENGECVVTCIVTHIGGHKESTTLKGAPDSSGGKNLIQAKISTNSYLERKTLQGALGIVVEGEDDDGQGGAKHASKGEYASILKPPTEKEFNGAMKRVADGSLTLDKIMQYWALNEEQEKLIREMEESRSK